MTPYTLEQDAARCVVTWRHFSWIVIFLFVWITIWTGGCIMLGYLVFAERQLGMLLFALPFWAGWILVAGLIVNIFFGKTQFQLDEDGFESDWFCLFVHRNKRIPLDGIRRFEVHEHRGSKGSRTYSLRVVCQQEKDADYMVPGTGVGVWETLCEQLNSLLATLKNDPKIADEPVNPSTKPEPIVFELNTPAKELERPESSSWHNEQDFDGFGFRKRGVFSLGNSLGSLFLCCFWNGIVGVFLLALFGVLPFDKPMEPTMWWVLFFFLIPFELIGLVILYGFVQTVLEPFRVTKWSFRYAEVTFQPGFGRAKTFLLDGWKTLTVRLAPENDDDDEKFDADIAKKLNDAAIWELAFLDRDGTAIVTVDELSKPEALWMADVVLREKRSIL